MLIPIRSDRPLKSTPYVNYALIVANVIVFILTTRQLSSGEVTDAHHGMLWSQNTKIWQFITYQFLHDGVMHLAGNMIFLWVFGNAVEDRLGKLGYLFFYLTTGVLAGLAHTLSSDFPVLGASGSVAGVTGAYLALFPRTRVTIIYFFFLIGAFEIQATWLVLFYFALDLYFFTIGVGNTAYSAHLVGYLSGFGFAMMLLGTRLLPREVYDMFSIWQHKRRKSEFKRITQRGYQPWEGRQENRGRFGRKPSGNDDETPVFSEQDMAAIEARKDISRAIGAHDMAKAAALYKKMLDTLGDQVLSQRHQYDIANHLAGQGEHATAARAYELLLQAYPTHDERGHVQLMLGLINARYLGRAEQARPLLQEASQRLHGDDAQLARQLLSEIG